MPQAKTVKDPVYVIFVNRHGKPGKKPLKLTPDETGTVTINKGSYIIAPGTCWPNAGKLWTLILQDVPHSLNPMGLDSKYDIGPQLINEIAENNYTANVLRDARDKKVQAAKDWIVMGGLILVIVASFYFYDQTSEQLDGLQIQLLELENMHDDNTGQAGEPRSREDAGHNDIGGS